MKTGLPFSQSWRERLHDAVASHTAWLQTLIALLLVLINLAHGEIIGIAGGRGFDGFLYALIARDQKGVLTNRIPAYYLQRVLPSRLVHYGLQLLQVPMSGGNVVMGFRIFDGALFVVGAFIWGRIGDLLHFQNRSKWLAFVFLYGCFANLKYAFYYPVLTDQMAFFLGLLLLYFFLKNQSAGVLAVSIIGAFTFPTLMTMSMILFVMPRRDTGASHSRTWVALALAGLITLGILFGIVGSYILMNGQPAAGEARLEPAWLLPSVGVALLYVLLGSFFLLRGCGLVSLRKAVEQVSLSRLLLAIGVSVLTASFIARFSADSGSVGLEMSVATDILVSAITRPGIFLVSHVVYFGPVVLIALFAWRRIAQLVGGFGIGLSLFFIANLTLTLTPESRQFVPFEPFLVAFTVMALQGLGWSPASGWLAGLLTLLYSKFWLPLNWAWMGSAPPAGMPIYPEQFPFQIYFMNFGPYMSNEMYLVQGAVVLLTALVLYRVFFLRRTKVTVAARQAEGMASL